MGIKGLVTTAKMAYWGRTETLILELLQVVVLELLAGYLDGLLEMVERILLGTAGVTSTVRRRAHVGVGASHTSLQ